MCYEMEKGRSGCVPMRPSLDSWLNCINLDTVNVPILEIFYLLPNQEIGEFFTVSTS